jgi:hypothetical protein
MEILACSEGTNPLQSIDAVRVPKSGIPTECNCLHISGSPDGSRPLDLWWTAYRKNTGLELRTSQIPSDQLERWLAGLERPD